MNIGIIVSQASEATPTSSVGKYTEFLALKPEFLLDVRSSLSALYIQRADI